MSRDSDRPNKIRSDSVGYCLKIHGNIVSASGTIWMQGFYSCLKNAQLAFSNSVYDRAYDKYTGYLYKFPEGTLVSVFKRECYHVDDYKYYKTTHHSPTDADIKRGGKYEDEVETCLVSSFLGGLIND